MKIESIDNEDARLYFEHYEIIQLINNELQPASEEWARSKLRQVLKKVQELLESDGFPWSYESTESPYVAIYPSEDWHQASDNLDVAAFLRLETDFKDRTKPSTLGITCRGKDQLVASVEDFLKQDGAELLLKRAHGRKSYEQFYRHVDWFDDYDGFDEMAESLASDLNQLVDALQTVLESSQVTPK